MEWWLELGLKEVAVFALAINNLQREKKEVDTLLDLIKNSFERFSKQREFFEENGIKVNICGKIEMLPEDVQKPLHDVMNETKHNTNAILHIYIWYSSTQEYEDALVKSREQSINSELEMSQELLESNFYAPDFEPEILIRTSNEIRLSNFMLFQSKNWQISFVKNYWPEFSIWDLFKIIIGNGFQ